MATEAFTFDCAAPSLLQGQSRADSLEPYEFRSIAANGQDYRLHAESSGISPERMEADRRRAFEEGRNEGAREARAQMEAATAAAIAQERLRIAKSIEDFRAARTRYFSAVEREIIRLALAVASQVLHREVQLDPALLAGVVRVALDRLADRSGVILRAPADAVSRWEGIFQKLDPADRPTVVAALLPPGECVLETSVGVVELGVAAQLEEIQRGFFDLLEHRPAS